MDDFVKNLIDPRSGRRLIEALPDAFAIQDLPPPPMDEAPHGVDPSILVSKKERNSRMDICNACPTLRRITKLCAECNCLMPAKTWLTMAACPQGKWGKSLKGRANGDT